MVREITYSDCSGDKKRLCASDIKARLYYEDEKEAAMCWNGVVIYKDHFYLLVREH